MKSKIIKIDLNKSGLVICALLVLYNFFSKLPFIHARDLSWDEPFSAFYSQFSIPQIITEMFKGNNPPFYELFLHVYTAVFGISEYALRMPSILFSCGTVAFLYLTGERLKGKWVGIFVALLFSLNNLQFFYSLAARMYALFSMLVAASIYLSVVSYQEPTKRKYYYWLLAVNVLMCYTHYFAGFVIVAEVLAWLVTFRNRIFFRNIFLVFTFNLILVIPMLLVFKLRAEGYVGAFEFKPPYPEIWKNIIMNLVNGLDVYNSAYTFLVAGLAIYIVIILYRRQLSFKNTYYFVLLFILFALPLSLTWYFGNTYPLFIDRYYLYATIPLFLFVAISLSTFFRPIGRLWVPVFFIYLLNIYNKNFTRLNSDYMLREWQGAAITAKQLQMESPNSIILIDPLWADLGFSYYYDRNLYKSGNNYNADLGSKKVYRLWSGDSLSKILEENKGQNIIFYCDENVKVDSTNNGHYRLLQRNGYIRDTAYFFPLCTTVIKFHPGDSTSR
jgi:4-amino-4-deoxy-L-arabinose transferase-like glycosyltransferase